MVFDILPHTKCAGKKLNLKPGQKLKVGGGYF
jgi:hypothetical protein